MNNPYTPKKIALEGAPGTGKTTILEYYQKKHSGNSKIAFVTEAGTEYLIKNPSVDYRSDKGISRAIQTLALKKEMLAHKSEAETIISDRSVVSALVFEHAKGDEEEFTTLLKQVEHWLPTYTIFLICDPTDVPFSLNGVRRGNADERQRYHEAFLKVFQILKLPYKIISGSVEERVKIINKLLV